MIISILAIFAREYSEIVQAAGGVVTLEDFERYDVRYDEPARGSYRGYELVGSRPPTTVVRT